MLPRCAKATEANVSRPSDSDTVKNGSDASQGPECPVRREIGANHMGTDACARPSAGPNVKLTPKVDSGLLWALWGRGARTPSRGFVL